MPTYVTVSRGAPGERHVTPVVASSDPEIVRKVLEVMARTLISEGSSEDHAASTRARSAPYARKGER